MKQNKKERIIFIFSLFLCKKNKLKAYFFLCIFERAKHIKN